MESKYLLSIEPHFLLFNQLINFLSCISWFDSDHISHLKSSPRLYQRSWKKNIIAIWPPQIWVFFFIKKFSEYTHTYTHTVSQQCVSCCIKKNSVCLFLPLQTPHSFCLISQHLLCLGLLPPLNSSLAHHVSPIPKASHFSSFDSLSLFLPPFLTSLLCTLTHPFSSSFKYNHKKFHLSHYTTPFQHTLFSFHRTLLNSLWFIVSFHLTNFSHVVCFLIPSPLHAPCSHWFSPQTHFPSWLI